MTREDIEKAVRDTYNKSGLDVLMDFSDLIVQQVNAALDEAAKAKCRLCYHGIPVSLEKTSYGHEWFHNTAKSKPFNLEICNANEIRALKIK